MKTTRRTVLKYMGLSLALPALPSEAQTAPARRRFIGCYVPNGAYMPGGANGNWTWTEALEPLATRNLQGNAMILRRLFNGIPGHDPHWQNCAGFLSCDGPPNHRHRQNSSPTIPTTTATASCDSTEAKAQPIPIPAMAEGIRIARFRGLYSLR